MQMRTMLYSMTILIGLALAAGPSFAAKDEKSGLSGDGTAAAAAPAPRGDRDSQAGDGRGPVRVAPIFRDVTEADIADILAFVDENLPWQRPELDRLRASNADQFRQVCRHMRYEVAQMKDLKARDPEAFRKAIEEKQLRFRAQDIAAKARAAADPAERAALTEELRKIIDKLFDVELATREAQAAQLESRLDALRAELKARSANREQVVKARLDEMLKGKKDGGSGKFRPDSRPPEKSERHEKSDKSDKGDRSGDRK